MEYEEGGWNMRCKIFERKPRVMRRLVARVIGVVLAISIIWLPGNEQAVYAEEAEGTEEKVLTEREIRNVNLNIDGKIAGISDPTPAKSQDAQWSNGTGSYINFGHIMNQPTKYRVLDSDTTDFSIDGTHTMLLELNNVLEARVFDNDRQNADNGQSKPNDWKYSDMYLYLNSETGIAEPYTKYSYGYFSACGSEYETGIITESYNTSHLSWIDHIGNSYSELTGEKIFLLDSREATHGAYGYYEGAGESGSLIKTRNKSWALRSSVSDTSDKAQIVTSKGTIENQFVNLQSFGVSPAFNIDKSSIFFIRADYECDHENFVPTTIQTSNQTWNLTLFDGNTTFSCERLDSGTLEYGDTININITAIGDFDWGEWHCPGKYICYDQISALIEDKNGNVVYYGGISDREKGLSNTGCGEIKIPVPQKLEDGTYTLKIFAEDVNLDVMSNTHYASNVVEFPIEIVTRDETGIAFENYNPSATYSGDILSNPTESQLTIIGADYQDVNFTWYKDSVSEDNKLESAPSNAGVYYLVASIADTPTLKASSVTSEPIEISPKTVTPYISGSISKIYDGTSSTENAISSLNVELNGVLSSDSVSVDGFSFSYIDSEIGTGKTITATNITLSGADKDNYVLSSSTATAEVGTIGKREKPLNIPEQEISVANTVKFVADSMNLPEGWEWNDGDGEKTIAAGKTVTATAIYTAEDGCYYETTSEEISITRADCEENLDIIVDLEPTCTEKGIGHTICSLCGDTLRESVEISELGHDWNDEYTIDREADCTNKGSKSLHCSRCEGKKDIIEITALGHLWGNGTVTKVASCMENGIMMYSCENCSETKTESISKLAHAPAKTVMENQIQPDCINGGSYDEVQYCSVCQAELSRNYITVAAVGHSLIKVEAKEPTVSETGNTEYWKCEGCSQLFSDENGTNITTIEAVTIPVKETGTSNSGNTNNGSNNDSDINNGKTDGESGGGNYTGNTEESGDVAINPPVNADSQGKPEDSGLNANNSSQVEHPENGTNGDSFMNTDSSDHTDNVNNKDSVDGQKEENTVKDDTTGTGTKTEQSKVTVPSVGTVLKDTKTNSKYVVTSKKSKTVRYSGTIKKNTSTVSIPATVKIDGVTYKVTSIQTNAFRNNKKIKKIIIGSNIKKIGKNAFYGCKNLKSITIRSTQLTEKMVGGNAFKGIDRKAVIKVPKEKHKIYQKLLKSRGFKGKIKAVSLK